MKLLNNEKIKTLYNTNSFYIYYDIIKEVYPKSILSHWYYHKYISDTTKQVAREEWSTLKEVDEETFYCLYNRQYNPVVITISKNETNNENYNIMLSLFSIDDTAFKILLENKTLLEKEDIILEIIDYIDFNDIINYRSFLTYGIEVLKGIDVSY